MYVYSPLNNNNIFPSYYLDLRNVYIIFFPIFSDFQKTLYISVLPLLRMMDFLQYYDVLFGSNANIRRLVKKYITELESASGTTRSGFIIQNSCCL